MGKTYPLAMLFLGLIVSPFGCDDGTSTTTTTSTATSSSSSTSSGGGSGGAGGAECSPVDDSNECTDDLCENDTPVHKPTAVGSPCSVNGTRCDGIGNCIECMAVADCPGMDGPCETRSCIQGKCVVDLVPAGGIALVQPEGDCQVAVCVGLATPDQQVIDFDIPDDKNPCTYDICDSGVPSNPPLPAGIECGSSLFCDGAGKCVGCNVPSDCPGDNTECVTKTCLMGTCGIEFAPLGAPVAAQSNNDCVRAVCDGNGNYVNVVDDSDLPYDFNECTDDVCNAGVPNYPPKPNGTLCFDGNLCTQTDTCQSGACTGANPVTCAAPTFCQVLGACDPATGICSNPSQPNGLVCNDSNTCTQNDSCQSGACAGANSHFAAKVDYPTGDGTLFVVAADLNADGKPDLAAVNSGGNSVSVRLNNGMGAFGPNVDYGTGTNPRSVATADFDGNGTTDLVVPNSAASSVSVLFNNGNGTFGAANNYATNMLPGAVTAADLNGDGKPDLAVLHLVGAGLGVLLNNGNGSFAAPVDYGTGQSPYAVVAADLNGDGKADLAIANKGGSSVSVLFNNGNGTFVAGGDYGTGANPGSVAAADVNGDGKLDIVTANDIGSSVTVWFNNGNGTFGSRVDYPTGSNPFSVAVANMDGDNKLDIVTANLNGGSVSVLFNDGNGAFSTRFDYPTDPGCASVAAADFNGDDKVDLAVVTFSSNVSVLLSTCMP